MAGPDDDDLNLHASLDGDLAEALARIEKRLDSTERKLDAAGKAGEEAGDRIERGAADAAEALGRVERAADGADRDLAAMNKQADKSARQMREMTRAGAEAAAGLEATEHGAEGAAEALGDTERKAKGAARALDDAGDEAAEAGVKAAASSLGWGKLWRSIDQNERVTRRFQRLQDSMSWSSWTARADKFKASASRLFDEKMWDKGAKGLGKVSKAFKGFMAVLLVGKVVAVVQAVYALLGALSALSAGAIGAVGGIGAMLPSLVALVPLLATAGLMMVAFKAAAKPVADELDALKSRFAGFGNEVAQGGLRKGLISLNSNLGFVEKQSNRLGKSLGSNLGTGAEALGRYAAGATFARQTDKILTEMDDTASSLTGTLVNLVKIMVSGLAGASPVASMMAADIYYLVKALSVWMEAEEKSGATTRYLTHSYNLLRDGLQVVWKWAVGLGRIFRIGAQESKWMGDSIKESADRFDKWTGSLEGQNAIRKWFQDSMPAVRETLLLLRDLSKWLFNVGRSQDVQPLLAQIRTELLPAFTQLADKMKGDLIPRLIDLATKLALLFAGFDFSALGTLVWGLSQLVDGLLWLSQNVPGANFALSALFTTLLLVGPVTKLFGGLFGAIGKLIGAGKWIAAIFGDGKDLSMAQKAIQWIGKGIWWLISLLRGPLVTAFTWVGRMLATAFLGSNPVGWIILAIIALVAAFWWCYDNIAGFRNAVDAVLRAVGQFFVDCWDEAKTAWAVFSQFMVDQWNGWIKPTLDFIWLALKFLGAVIFTILVAPFIIAWNILAAIISWWLDNCWKPFADEVAREWRAFYDGTLKPVGDGIIWVLDEVGKFFGWVNTALIQPAIQQARDAWAFLGTALSWVNANIIQPSLSAVGAFFVWVWQTMIKPGIDFWVGAWNLLGVGLDWVNKNIIQPSIQAVGEFLTWVYQTMIKPGLDFMLAGWHLLGDGMSWVQVNIIQPALDAVGHGLDILQGWFQSAVDGIARIWRGIQNATAVPVNFLINTVWNQGILKAWNWVAEKLGIPTGAPIAPIPEYNRGGAIRGAGTDHSDSITARVANNEHIWTAQEVREAGGHGRVMALRQLALRGGARAVDSFLQYGGESLAQFADGGAVAVGQNWARQQVGKPYSWGSAGPGGYDCSGAMSALTNVLTNSLPVNRRIFSTGSFSATRGAGGFVPGLGSAFAIGVSPNTGRGIGHMAGTLGGMNVESSGGVGFHVGGGALGADAGLFPWKFSLPQVGGQFVSGGGGGFGASLWSLGRPILDAILNPIISAIPFHGPPAFMDIPKAMATTARDKFYGWAEEKLNALFGGGGGAASGAAGSPAVVAAVQAVAARYGWGSGAEWSALQSLVSGESGWNPNAHNPTSSAAGLFQKMTSIHGPLEPTPAGQAEWGLSYIRGTYGSPSNAYAKWLARSPHWYDDGGMLQPGLSLVANGTGRPEPVFTHEQWDMLDPTNIITAMQATPPSLEARAASERESELAGAVHALSTALAERPPAMAVSGDDTRRAVLAALDQRDREQRTRKRYQYGG